jgi:periplasmic mercuric ion binding protein
MRKRLTLLMLLIFSPAAWSAERIVTLSIQGMNCPVCPITVKKALSRVDGVASVSIDYENRKATVEFDDAVTDTSALRRATREAGYPSTVSEEGA